MNTHMCAHTKPIFYIRSLFYVFIYFKVFNQFKNHTDSPLRWLQKVGVDLQRFGVV